MNAVKQNFNFNEWLKDMANTRWRMKLSSGNTKSDESPITVTKLKTGTMSFASATSSGTKSQRTKRPLQSEHKPNVLYAKVPPL